MLDLLRWLIAIELLGFAGLPLAMWALRSLPDRGYIFAKPLALLLVTYLTWLLGSIAPVARSPLLPGAFAVIIGAVGWWLWRRETLEALRAARHAVLIEEALFVGGLVVLSLMRVNTFGSGISHTEQFMDMALMNASLHSASYPPFDPWMSGHTINYYYFGYLIVATLTKLAAVPAAVAYNLALSAIFGLALGCAYAIGYALTRHLLWPLLASLLLAVVGNWHALLWSAFHGASCPNQSTFWGPIWESTRIVGSGFTLANWASGPPWTRTTPCGVPTNTINEYPLFSFILGDMHPHVMALPFTLLVIGLAVGVLRDSTPLVAERSSGAIGRLVLLSIAVGSLFTINSWDFPTYFLVLAACIMTAAYLRDDSGSWWRQPLLTSMVLGILSVVLYAPFYLHFKSIAQGIGRVTTPTDVYELFQVFGLFLLGGAVLAVCLSLLLQPATEEDVEAEEPLVAAETGRARLDFGAQSGAVATVAVLVLAVLAVVLHLAVLLLLLVLAASALVLLHRVLNTDDPNLGDAGALLLLAAGCAVIALPEVIYLRDAFDGSASYRMNTVFKFYYQGWTLLSLASAYGAYRSWHVLRALYRPLYGWIVLAVLAAGTLGAGTYTAWAFSATSGDTTSRSLDGAAWIQSSNPGDIPAFQWLRDHASERSVVLEAVGDDYSYAARVSTFTGLPTVMGWIGHEQQWRGADPEIQQRVKDVSTMYGTTDTAQAKSLMQRYDVRYVVIGQFERERYAKSPAGLAKFARFMRPVFQSQGTTIYTW